MTESEFHQRQAVLAEAIEWLNTPFHHNQCCKGAGVDCANFLYGVFKNAGLAPELDIGHYPPDWYLHRDEERFLGWVTQFGRKIEEPPFKPADVVMYRYGRCFAHSAIVIEWPKIIHAYSPAGRVRYASAFEGPLEHRPREIYRYKDWA
jgi:cell wall-associated NlpC family hydrolase